MKGEPWLDEVHNLYDEETMKQLMKFGLACYKYTDIGITASGVVNVILFAEGLAGGRWLYQSSEDLKDISVPTDGRLFVGFCSMCNVQVMLLASAREKRYA